MTRPTPTRGRPKGSKGTQPLRGKIGIRLEKEYEDRLNRIAKLTGRKKTYYMRKGIIQYLDQLETALQELKDAIGEPHETLK